MSNKQFTITAVKALPEALLSLTFADGLTLRVDLKPIVRKHPSLRALNDPATFRRVKLGEWGGSVRWANNDALELAADNLRARAIEQNGGYSHELIIAWMSRHKLTLDAAAQALGLSRRMLAYYRAGHKPVPRTVALACLGWEVEQRKAA
ncbi:MAG: DUF2442 domain-containing protein [Pseudomonadales bacterium]|jgi:hypothetical protein|nr:DUF2442 domain-containing protein [Pseudomonadales bacterium]